MFHQTIDQAQPGDQLGILLKNIRREDVRRGVFVGKPGSLKMYNKFDCQVKFNKKLFVFFSLKNFFSRRLISYQKAKVVEKIQFPKNSP
jgi:translation elongation factor EF-1alpha